MARGLQIRLACAAALLAAGMSVVVVGARLGVVHVNAGDMTIVLGGGAPTSGCGGRQLA